MNLFFKNFRKQLHFPSGKAGIQYLLIFIAALLLTRVFMESIDRLFFSPESWETPISDSTSFYVELKERASEVETEGDSLKLILENDTMLVALPKLVSLTRDSKIIVRRNIGDTLNITLVKSDYSILTGMRSFSLDRKNVQQLSKIVGDKKLRWIQSVIEASESSVRLITLSSGLIQLIMYLFFFIGLLFVLIEAISIQINKNLLVDREIIPIFMQRERISKLQKLINKLRGIRLKNLISDEISPSIVLDMTEPGYKFLLSCHGRLNNSEMHTVLEAASNSILEKLNSRYQIIRYFVLTIPSLGFIGTVLGISQALGYTGVMTSDALPWERMFASHGLSSNLSVAFDTTLVGLVASIILGFIVDVIETRSVGFVLKARKYIMENIGNIKEMKEDTVQKEIEDK